MANAIIERVGGVGVDCDDATATTAQVLSGKTFGGSASDEIQTGGMANQGKKTYTISTNNGSVTIPQGYHDGTGKVTYSLPSVNGGNTYTPTAAAQSIVLSGKYLKSNITVSGSSNLVAGNIRSGKNIWGVGGSFVNFDDVSRVYNGSAFSGWMNGGVVAQPNGVKRRYGFNCHWNSLGGYNRDITSGSLYLKRDDRPTVGRDSDYSAMFVSKKSIAFSHFSQIRITGSYTSTLAGKNNDDMATGVAEIAMHIRLREVTNVSGTIHSVAYSDWLTTPHIVNDTSTFQTKTVSFDLSTNISSWTEDEGYLCLEAWNYNYDASTWGGNYRGETFTINGIYLT